MIRSTFSITMIASSTTMPIASTIANSVSWLTVKPIRLRPRKVPSKATGITSVGMIVARRFCRNSSITRNTSTTASISVFTTSRIEMRTKVVLSNGVYHSTPAGKVACSSSMRAVTASATDSAFAPGCSITATAPVGWLLNFASKP